MTAGSSTVPSQALQWLRSLIFILQMYGMMALMSLVFIPWAMVDARASYRGVRLYCRWVRWSAAWMVGLRSEIRGTPPTGDALICAKHQSFFDILMLASVLEQPRFVMKKQLLATPIVGHFARKIGCIAVDRGKGRHAVKQLLAGAHAPDGRVGQLIIYPQGTRVPPGTRIPYKVGAAVLHDALDCDCIPVATNVGVFWPRAAILRKPGRAVVEFLPRCVPGQETSRFMTNLETTIETQSDTLMREAGFAIPDPEPNQGAR